MKIVGIITEYNPFHLGHHYQIQQAKKQTGADYILVIMSGHFVQRGEPAFADKWLRTEMVLAGGADLVIELPLPYAVSSAEIFAYGAVKLLNDLNCVDLLVFGSESGNIHDLQQLATVLAYETPHFKATLHHFLDQGLSFPTARQATLKAILESTSHPNAAHLSELLDTSNNILGIEYLKALIKLNSNIKPITIERVGSAYTDETLSTTFASATAIRKSLFSNGLESVKCYLPESSYSIIEREYLKRLPIQTNDLFPLLKYRLLNESNDSLTKYMDISEGIEHKILKNAPKHSNYDTFVSDLKSKRYPKTRIQRSLIHVLLGLTEETIAHSLNTSGSGYARVLGFNSQATPLLKKLNDFSFIPLLTTMSNDYSHLNTEAQRIIAADFYGTSLYQLVLQQKFNYDLGNDFTQPIVIKKER